MLSRSKVADKFRAINAHDETVEGFRFVSAVTSGRKSKVEVMLFRHWEGKHYLLTFSGCANVEVALDADVLAHNSPNNTEVLQASTDSAEIERIMRRHKRSWNVWYHKSIDPLSGKLLLVEKLVLFKIQMFGGMLHVVARGFSRRRVRISSKRRR